MSDWRVPGMAIGMAALLAAGCGSWGRDGSPSADRDLDEGIHWCVNAYCGVTPWFEDGTPAARWIARSKAWTDDALLEKLRDCRTTLVASHALAMRTRILIDAEDIWLDWMDDDRAVVRGVPLVRGADGDPVLAPGGEEQAYAWWKDRLAGRKSNP